MTYCVGMLVNAGLVMMADTRTNAGVDNISTYRKLHIYDGGDDCFITIATAGNLSVTQSTLSKIAEGVPHPQTGEVETLWTMPSIFKAVQLVGRVLRDTRHEAEVGMQAEGISFGATMLLGGRVGAEPLRLFMIYDAGNAIECHADTPYLQIGEYKYGKPILDRALDGTTPMNEAVKLGLISFDSTMRSNLAVGLPIDMVIVRADREEEPEYFRIEAENAYFKELSRQWGDKLRDAQAAIPRPPFIRPRRTGLQAVAGNDSSAASAALAAIAEPGAAVDSGAASCPAGGPAPAGGATDPASTDATRPSATPAAKPTPAGTPGVAHADPAPAQRQQDGLAL